MALTDAIVRTRLTREEKSLNIPWPAGNPVLYWELDSVQFTAGTVAITIEVSFDGGATFRQTKRTGFDFDCERALRGRAPGPIAGTHGPFMANGQVVIPTHYRIGVSPIAGSPRVGVRAER